MKEWVCYLKKNIYYFGNFAAFSFPQEKQNLIGQKEHWFGSVKKIKP